MADKQARDAEKALTETLDAYIAGRGPAPGADQESAVRELRKQATDRLSMAVNYLKK